MQFTNVGIVLESENNTYTVVNYTCKRFTELILHTVLVMKEHYLSSDLSLFMIIMIMTRAWSMLLFIVYLQRIDKAKKRQRNQVSG